MKQSPSPTTEAESTKYSCSASLAARVQACDPNSANQTHPPQTLNLKSVRGSRELAEPLLGKVAAGAAVLEQSQHHVPRAGDTGAACLRVCAQGPWLSCLSGLSSVAEVMSQGVTPGCIRSNPVLQFSKIFCESLNAL